jgi:hypothetical protein
MMRQLDIFRPSEWYGLEAGPIGYQPQLWDGEEQGDLFPLQ